mmetsp:Transcript_45849/g.115463  ORF Transcript_45849/g.115463 Transcript_45849/m.115463 type:complete len:383 (+) Transcript_45849:305-1453(+)|eukprot:CAMPEP_0177681932 /NCGR_PEP_ID=MMETSP0447-20121125/30989_1 /TAXON_ID=0 /ORGANISM="Stygamoeba regulata, Strain BSH-02190019" /LENGTH=382 /DNA_ID=CAMNT_0019191401 /DNA_START=370 /DNA_END=1518 /DNA_ORIENTATION=-
MQNTNADADAVATNRPGNTGKRKRDEEASAYSFPYTAMLEGRPYVFQDDEHGHLVIHPSEDLGERYQIISVLGEGTFAKVIECFDRRREIYVAIKIVKNVPRYRDAAETEVAILRKTRATLTLDARVNVRMLSFFELGGHMCIVFPRYGPSLYDVIKMNGFRGLPVHVVIAILFQLFNGLAFLHEQLLLTHTDLKPENIVFCTRKTYYDDKYRAYLPSSLKIKIIDFGSATFEHAYHSTVVSTRHYRAPEVILDLGWSYPCDIWSVGCIVMELFSGLPVFQTHSNVKHLAMMEKVLAKPVPRVMSQNTSKSHYFTATGGVADVDDAGVATLRTIEQIVPKRSKLQPLVRKMLCWEPNSRSSAGELLEDVISISPTELDLGSF